MSSRDVGRGVRGLTRGFTVIELLVVVSIIGLLVALVLPAVLSSRAADRSARCANNLKQIGLALSAHESAAGRFPSGMATAMYVRSGLPYAPGSPFSAQTFLLPYLDQQPLYNGINIPPIMPFSPNGENLWAFSPNNLTARLTALGAFLCPADSDGSTLKPGSNYCGNCGSYPGAVEGAEGGVLGGGGLFPALIGVAYQDITDGASQTAAFSERLRGRGDLKSFSPSRDIWLTGVIYVKPNPTSDEMFAICSSLSSSYPPSESASYRYWIIGDYGQTLYNHISPPNWQSSDCDLGAYHYETSDLWGGCFTARSNHPGGVNVLFADGSVRFTRASINLAVWRGMGTRSGGETISAR